LVQNGTKWSHFSQATIPAQILVPKMWPAKWAAGENWPGDKMGNFYTVYDILLIPSDFLN
jgi:hypothetical protein